MLMLILCGILGAESAKQDVEAVTWCQDRAFANKRLARTFCKSTSISDYVR